VDFSQLLDEDQRFQLFILRFLDLTVDDYITISKLVEVTGQSKFKLVKFIQSLNYDLHEFRGNCRIVIQDDVLVTENIDLTVIKLLQIDYFKNSQVFQLLLYLLEESGSIDKYAESHFLSQSKVYAVRKQLVSFLKLVDIKVKKNQLIGEEFAVRNTLSTLIFECLNGYYSPFSNEVITLSKKIIEFLTYFFDLRLTPTQNNKFTLLTSISLARCKHGRPISHSFFSESNKIFSSVEKNLRYLSNEIDVDLASLKNELSYLSMFLFTEGELVNELEDNFDFSYFESIDYKSEELSNKILDQIKISYQIDLSQDVRHEYTRRLKQVNRKRAIYSFETSSFSTNKQIQSINELYPVYSSIIWNEITEAYAQMSKDQISRCFYDYLFILIDVNPPELIEQPVHVCVDFSQGSDYTNFIIKQIEGFKDLNLVIEHRVSVHTKILISNCVWENFKGAQIVWKNPPTPSDWEFFGNTVVRIKKEFLFSENDYQMKGGT
jgi:hypothetical protein